MKRLGINIVRKKQVQASAQLSLAASAAPPDSGFAFVHNSQGASAALSEFSGVLSGALRQIDLEEGSEDGLVKAQLRRLETAAGDYANSSSESCTGLTEWEASQSLAQIVAATFSCAASVYGKPPKSELVHDSGNHSLSGLHIAHRQPETAGVVFKELEYFEQNKQGTNKAMGVWMAESERGSEGLPALVIAIRGTSGFMDSMVNANGRPLPAADYLGISRAPSIGDTAADITAHAGFLNSAMALDSSVSRHLSRAYQETPDMHVVFTGHSAGGAVASILYVKCLLEASTSYPGLKLSCVTFGAPPALSHDITDDLQKAPSLAKNRGYIIAFVNEFDIVPRVDQAYMRSLIDLYLSSYNLEPLMAGAVPRGDSQMADNTDKHEVAYVLPPLAFQLEEENDNLEDHQQGERAWKLPRADYHILGQVVILKKGRGSSTRPAQKVARQLRAATMPLHEYEKLLFCGIQTHSRSYYGDRMELLRRGALNHRESWQTDHTSEQGVKED